MSTPRPAAAVFAAVLLVALAACGPGTPSPGSSPGGSSSPSPSAGGPGTASPEPTADGDPTSEPVDDDVTVVVNSGLIRVVTADDGELLATVDYTETDHVAAAARIATALGSNPAITTTSGTGSGCDTDQTIYDFGGFLLRSPGFVGSIGTIEVQIDGATTAGGVPIVTVGGAQVGMSRAAFESAVGVFTDLGSSGSSAWIGFDQSNPGAEEYEAIGSIARIDSGIVARINSPFYFFGDC